MRERGLMTSPAMWKNLASCATFRDSETQIRICRASAPLAIQAKASGALALQIHKSHLSRLAHFTRVETHSHTHQPHRLTAASKCLREQFVKQRQRRLIRDALGGG